ncbi:hypothetical protein BJ165DRAFT_805144 [Panaeolus papilionaceus]|nr:hypothetical protein BJ165DRAFT_805144 [Panaeolus papilionaceus]
MFQVVAQHGFHLKPWQKASGVEMPYRYCIVNKHIGGSKYEVFLLTTFGGVRSASDLSMIGKVFGMPMGNTGWINDVKPLQTNPPIFSFGLLRKSFVFSIPFVASIEDNDTDKRLAVGGRVRLLTSDLQRLRAFAASKVPVGFFCYHFAYYIAYNEHASFYFPITTSSSGTYLPTNKAPYRLSTLKMPLPTYFPLPYLNSRPLWRIYPKASKNGRPGRGPIRAKWLLREFLPNYGSTSGGLADTQQQISGLHQHFLGETLHDKRSKRPCRHHTTPVVYVLGSKHYLESFDNYYYYYYYTSSEFLVLNHFFTPSSFQLGNAFRY